MGKPLLPKGSLVAYEKPKNSKWVTSNRLASIWEDSPKTWEWGILTHHWQWRNPKTVPCENHVL